MGPAPPDRDVTCTRPTITSPFNILSDQPDAVPENDVDTHLSRTGPCAATIEHVNNNKIRRSPTFSLSSHDRPDTHRSKRVRFGAARTAVQFSSVDERGSQLCESHDASPSSQSQLTMPKRMNLSEARLRRSSRLKELRKKDEMNEASVSLTATTSKPKAHAPFGLSSRLQKAITLFALLSNVQDFKILSQPPPPNPRTMQRPQYRIKEVHELVNGTLYYFDHFALSTTAATNEVFICSSRQWRKKSIIMKNESIGLWFP